MLIKKAADIKSGEITDKKLYLTRRNFLRAAALAGSVGATGLFYRELFVPAEKTAISRSKLAGLQPSSVPLGIEDEPPTPYENITNYNNFYEFSTFKGGV